MANAFATKELYPNAQKWDQEKIFPIDVLKKAASLGFAGIQTKQGVKLNKKVFM